MGDVFIGLVNDVWRPKGSRISFSVRRSAWFAAIRFTHDRFVAVYGTFLARTLFLTERATVETGVCIAQQFFAVGAKNGILFFFPTVEAYHQLHCFLFACNTVFLHFIRFCRSGFTKNSVSLPHEKSYCARNVKLLLCM